MNPVRTIGRVVHQHDVLTSTMDEAARLAAFGAVEGTVVVADHQTAGRGRAGRSWIAAPGDALTCTVVLRPVVDPTRLSVLSLLAGVATARAIERVCGLPVWLKWPNDVWLGDANRGRKVAGVLVTSRLTGSGVAHVLVGIGINDRIPSAPLPSGATSIAGEFEQRAVGNAPGRTPPTRAVLFDALLAALDEEYRTFVTAAGRPSLDNWRTRAALLGESVSVEDEERLIHGVHAGVDDDGRLLLQQADGAVIPVSAGDLVRGPRYDFPGPLG